MVSLFIFYTLVLKLMLVYHLWAEIEINLEEGAIDQMSVPTHNSYVETYPQGGSFWKWSFWGITRSWELNSNEWD